jgi:hypothetical protein
LLTTGSVIGGREGRPKRTIAPDTDVAIVFQAAWNCASLAHGRRFARPGATMKVCGQRAFGPVAGMALMTVAAGCLDALGHQEDVIEHRSSEGELRLEDDRIEDKNPMFDPSRSVTESFRNGWTTCDVTMNKSAAVTKLDIVPFEGAESALDKKLFHGRSDALAAITGIEGADALPSMEVVNGALKPFNDGLYAAVELEAEAGKRALFSALAARLATLAAVAAAGARPAFDDASVLVGAAQVLAGEPPSVDVALQERARNRANAFQATAMYARAIGFYTWSPELERVFTRDRFLQNRDGEESFGALAAIAFALSQNATLLADYQRVTSLYAGLTNPYTSHPVDAIIPFIPSAAALADPRAIEAAFVAGTPQLKACAYVPVAFLPASRSKDSNYFDERFCFDPPAPGTNLLDVLVQGVRAGELDLAPASDAGWYDYQLYALETLLLPERGPESQNLLLTAGYKKKLIETFKSLLIQTRETHVKQLAFGAAASSGPPPPPIDLYPLLPAEPFPTFYLRTARGYRFLRTFLQASVGGSFLNGSKRVLESGVRGATPLAEELDGRVSLLYGLAFVNADAVGIARDTGLMPDEMAEIDVPGAVAAARAWLTGWKTDADVARDPRVIVPVFADYDRKVMKYWAVVGVKALVSRAEFVAGHEPVIEPTACWTGKLTPHRYTMLVEEVAELELPFSRPPPTRSELRAICDRHASKDQIVQALVAP